MATGEQITNAENIRKLADAIADQDDRLSAMERSSQLENSSVLSDDGFDISVPERLQTALDAYNIAKDSAGTINGKNSIYYQPSAPNNNDLVENDIWFDTNDGYKAYVWNGSSWEPMQFGPSAIADDAITARQLADNAVKRPALAPGSVDTDILHDFSVVATKWNDDQSHRIF